MGFGVAFQQNSSYHSNTQGLILNINPAYTFSGRYRAGIQFEGVFYNMQSTHSSLLTFDYYVINSPKYRFYVGGGYGFSNTSFSGGCGVPSMPGDSQDQETGKMGGTVRLGFNLRHLNIKLAYNFSPTIYTTYTTEGYPPSNSVYKNGYLGITLGVDIVGLKKSPRPSKK